MINAFATCSLSRYIMFKLGTQPCRNGGSWQLSNKTVMLGMLQSWVSTMASFVKSIDSKHLLTVGEEGFYPTGDSNPSGNQT